MARFRSQEKPFGDVLLEAGFEATVVVSSAYGGAMWCLIVEWCFGIMETLSWLT